MILALTAPAWGTPPAPELVAALLTVAPRVVAADRGVWADAQGMDAPRLARALLATLAKAEVADARAGVAATPVAAWLAARAAGDDALHVVPPGSDAAYVALFPLAALTPEARLRPLLDGLGLTTCGDLAALDHDAVEARLGPAGVALWRRARADDHRRLFLPIPRDPPHASVEWPDQAVSKPERLLFVLNALVSRVCEALVVGGQDARELILTFALADRARHVIPVRAVRGTAARATWMRLIRHHVERMKVVAPVEGIAVHAARVHEAEASQGDLFDRGFASARAADQALTRLVEDQGPIVVRAVRSRHPLVEARVTWEDPCAAGPPPARSDAPSDSEPRIAVGGRSSLASGPPPPARSDALSDSEPRIAVGGGSSLTSGGPPDARSGSPPAAFLGTPPDGDPDQAAGVALTLQLLPAPCEVHVETRRRRDHRVPVRYRDREGWHAIRDAAGPDRVSGGRWQGDRAYAREYFRCVTADGALVWLFRDARGGAWYLHGWWD
jgi:hypothetical protein